MRKVTKCFIWASIFDVISTIFGLSQGCVEMNIIVNLYGWIVGGLVKILATIFIVYMLETFGKQWFFWIAPLLVWFIVGWNFLNGFILMVQ